jgi:endonuclease/exonuclease/phosphatase family metal-dependent hydrolase
MNSLRVLTWNLNWTGPRQDRAPIVQRHISGREPDVACLTEIQKSTLPSHGSSLLCCSDHGYQKPPGYHKVALWSRDAWTKEDAVGASELPPGRFASGVTFGIRFVGVCIPWKEAHVNNGQRDKKLWQDHLKFLQALHSVVGCYLHAPEPVCLLGDFNQRIPRQGQPDEVFAALQAIMNLGLRPLTAGICDRDGNALIDHVAVGPFLYGKFDDLIPKEENGTVLSDHTGVAGELTMHSALKRDPHPGAAHA